MGHAECVNRNPKNMSTQKKEQVITKSRTITSHGLLPIVRANSPGETPAQHKRTRRRNARCGVVRLGNNAKWRTRNRMSGASDETPQETGERIAQLYREMSYPGAAKFQSALRKQGIKLSDAAVRELVAEQGGRQLFAPPPRFTGKVTARHVDERWAADLMDL